MTLRAYPSEAGRGYHAPPGDHPAGRPADGNCSHAASVPQRGCYAGAVADLVNQFSWSRTRDNVFQECRRRYYYQYYGAWAGWERNSDPLAPLLQLPNPHASPPT